MVGAFRSASSNEIQHYALVFQQQFKKKPDAKGDVGRIHNHFKRNPYPSPYTLREIVNAFCSGQTLMLAMVERVLRNPNDSEKVTAIGSHSREWADMHTLEFKSTQLLGIDIDDEHSETNVRDVLKHFKGKVAAAYYSFSHGKSNDIGGTQNRYRLLFQFDEPINDYEVGKEIVRVLRDELLQLYPNFPADKIDTMNPKTLWHGSSRQPILIDESAVLRTAKYVFLAEESLKAKQAEIMQRRKSAAHSLRYQTNNPIAFDELLEMAHKIGHLPSKTDTFFEWRDLCMSIRSHEYTGHITDAEGLQLFDIISGGESSESEYYNYKPDGSMSIGTFIKRANESGYRRKHKYGYALQEVAEHIETERIKVDKHIPSEVAEQLLNRRERLLVNSPTGSGKTSSFMNAFKRKASKEYRYFIFCSPTIPLTEQIAKEHEVMGITGGMKNLRQKITDKAIAGERIFVTTYDKAAELMYFLEKGISYGDDPQPEFYLVIDEFHKFTEAYNYRFVAIDRLEQLASVATSLIGLSGTCEDVLKDNFDKFITIDTGNKKSPCSDYRVFTYDTNVNGIVTAENADLMIVPVVRGLLQQSKVLLFINSKKRIQRIARLLKKEGINSRTVSSDNKSSATYTGIVETGEIDEDTQVILSTTVLADGISIKNPLDWSCVVVADRESPIFNPSTIKQISNRFRNPYRYFAIYMRSPNPDYAETRRFNIESDYQYRLRTVTGYVDYLNNEFSEELLKDFIPSKVEKHNGIFYKSKDDEAKIEFNPLYVRHQSMRQKERYYAAYRNAFMEEVGRILGHKSSGVFNVNDEVRKNESDLSSLLADLVAEKEEQQLESDVLRANFETFFDESAHNSLIIDNEEALAVFKKDVHPDLYIAAKRISPFADYETTKQLVMQVTNRNDTNKYMNGIQALAEIASFDYVKKVTVTERVFRELLKYEGKTYPSKDFKMITEEQLPKKLKVSKKDVSAALKLFNKLSTRPGGESHTNIRHLDIEVMAKIRHGIPTDAVEQSLLKYIGTRSEQQQAVMYPAIKKKYNVGWYGEE